MQLANGCGSGTLYTVGGGSGRMLITLAFFIVGSVIGSLLCRRSCALGGIDPILASDYLGPWGGLGGDAGEPRRRRARDRRRSRTRRGAQLHAVAQLSSSAASSSALLCVAVFLAGGHPWSVTFGFTVWGAQDRQRCSASTSRSAEFWQWPGPKRALADSVLTDTSSLTDFGMIFGAMAAAAADQAVRARRLAAAEIAARRRASAAC